MSHPATKKIEVLSSEVRIGTINSQDYICLTDIARYKGKATTDDLIRNWLRNRNTVEFLGLWEQINNPGFNPVEFDGIRMQAGLNSFTLTPKQWIEHTGAIGIQSTTGRYGGTYAHADIAFEFAAWISVEFKLYLIKEFQRLKDSERLSLGWDIRRNPARINYRIHTDAIQTHLIPAQLNKAQISFVYASEADLLNNGPLWLDCGPMASRKLKCQGQHSRSSHRCSACLPLQSRKPQRSVHQPVPASIRTSQPPKSDRHRTDETADGHERTPQLPEEKEEK